MKRLPVALGAVLLTAGLSGCEKPSPLVTVFSGRHLVHSEAQCYAFGDKAVSPQECAKQVRSVPELTIHPGETIGIDVAKDIADGGWIAAINGQRLSGGIVDGHYFKFALGPDAIAQAPLELQVIARGDDKQNKGVWIFKLVADKG